MPDIRGIFRIDAVWSEPPPGLPVRKFLGVAVAWYTGWPDSKAALGDGPVGFPRARYSGSSAFHRHASREPPNQSFCNQSDPVIPERNASNDPIHDLYRVACHRRIMSAVREIGRQAG